MTRHARGIGFDGWQALRYALLGFIGLGALGVGDVVLRYTYSLYLSFQPESFLREGGMLLAAVGGLGLLGGWLDRHRRPDATAARLMRGLLLALLFITLFQVFRQALATQLALPGWAKAATMLGCIAGGGIAAWHMPAASAARLGNAAALAIVTLFALQPGMPGYVQKAVMRAASPNTPAVTSTAAPAPRRSIVVVFDEWDMELSEKEGLFQRDSMRALLTQSFTARHALPAGSNTLESIPGMLMGEPFGEIARGGPGFLITKTGHRLDAQTPQMFKDLHDGGFSHAIVGYYHDYCTLFTTARYCHSEPVQFFAGWSASLMRVVRRNSELDFPYSVFLRQWHATYARLHDEALRAVEDRANAVVWIHINVPHPPSAIASRPPMDLRRDYRVNLDLTAELIEALRDRLVAQGDDASLVLTSDHWLRERELWAAMYEQQRGPGAGAAGKTGDQRVPFIVWFSRAGGAVEHQPTISAMALRQLVPGLLQGRIRSPQEVAAFFADQPPPVPPRSDGAGVH